MTTDQTPGESQVTAEAIAAALSHFLKEKTMVTPDQDQDIFESGVASSMFAMELVVFLEKSYQVEINGMDLKLANFRTIGAMTEMVLRLRRDANAGAGAGAGA
jgi:methoxymalonate biosynthesis acyl carrier protein